MIIHTTSQASIFPTLVPATVQMSPMFTIRFGVPGTLSLKIEPLFDRPFFHGRDIPLKLNLIVAVPNAPKQGMLQFIHVTKGDKTVGRIFGTLHFDGRVRPCRKAPVIDDPDRADPVHLPRRGAVCWRPCPSGDGGGAFASCGRGCAGDFAVFGCGPNGPGRVTTAPYLAAADAADRTASLDLTGNFFRRIAVSGVVDCDSRTCCRDPDTD